MCFQVGWKENRGWPPAYFLMFVLENWNISGLGEIWSWTEVREILEVL